MKMKVIIPFLVFIMAALGCIPVSSVSAATPTTYGSVIVDGKPLGFDTKPIIINGNTMVPFRKIFEALNMEVNGIPKPEVLRPKLRGQRLK